MYAINDSPFKTFIFKKINFAFNSELKSKQISLEFQVMQFKFLVLTLLFLRFTNIDTLKPFTELLLLFIDCFFNPTHDSPTEGR